MGAGLNYKCSLWVSYLFVFFNSFLLPGGLYYTMLLFPVFFIYSLRHQIILPYLIFIGISLVFCFFHLSPELNLNHYFKSTLISFLNISFLVNVYIFFKSAPEPEVSEMFKKLLYLNFLLVILAVFSFFIPFLKPTFWYLVPITNGSGIVPRLKLFTSEASIYSLLLSPLFLYYFFYYLLQQRLLNFHFFVFLIIPLLLSFSFGVGAGLFITVVITILFFNRKLLENRTLNQLVFFTGLMVIVLLFWVYVDNENILVLRLKNILSGSDTSAKGRTIESFIIAKKVLNQYHCWFWGIGPGQFKFMGKELLLSYYQYSGNVSDIRIPNACADTLIVYGYFGLVIRIGIQIILFFKTKVYQNYYRFSLFVFLFLYQFTGSYYNNLIEWTIWILVFSKAFKQFDSKKSILKIDQK